MKSMTGMGRARGQFQDAPLRVEVRSINHRFCEVNTRLPGRLQAFDLKIQRLIKSRLNRGKVDVLVFEEKTPDLSEFEANGFQRYHEFLSHVKASLGLESKIELRDLLPGVNQWIQRDVDVESDWSGLESLVGQALTDLQTMREREGDHLKEDIGSRFQTLAKIRDDLEAKADDLKSKIETRLKDRLAERFKDVELDEQRLQSEVIFYADRMDVAEELKRLESHLKQAEKLMGLKEPVGRKMDFLLQEFNREFNTIASKSQDDSVAHQIVDAKAELEKIREQIQNVE